MSIKHIFFVIIVQSLGALNAFAQEHILMSEDEIELREKINNKQIAKLTYEDPIKVQPKLFVGPNPVMSADVVPSESSESENLPND